MKFLAQLLRWIGVGGEGGSHYVQTDLDSAAGTNATLLELFRAHGVACVAQEEWIAFPDHGTRADTAIFKETQQPTGMSVQLDVRLEIDPDRTIVESFAGIGKTRREAVASAMQNFIANTFHVLLAAFFKPGDEHVTKEEWSIGGKTRQVTIGNVGIRGTPPVQGEQLVAWFKQFEENLKCYELANGTHWVRLYYGQIDHKALACEVLLDNNVWEEMQTEMAAIDWPSGRDYYSVRVFLVIKDTKKAS